MDEANLPVGWNMVTLRDVASYINGRAFKPSEWEESGLPIIRIQNLNDHSAPYNYSSILHEDKFLVRYGDLLFAWSASLGAHIWHGKDAWLNQHIFRVEPNGSANKKYLYYALKYIVTDLYAKTHGSGMVHITKGPFLATKIPLPLISEQEAIISKIDELFSDLDNSIEELQKIKMQLGIYRQAVLKNAFEGKLIKDSIRKNLSNTQQQVDVKPFNSSIDIALPLLPHNWCWTTIGEISNGVEYGSSKKSLKIGKIPVLRMGNIQSGKFKWSDLVYTDDDNEIAKYVLNAGDVLFNRTNSPVLVGKTAIYNGEQPAIFAGYLIRIKHKEYVNSRYLNYYLNSPIARQCGNKLKTDGVNQSNINGKKLCQYPFPLCSPDEQKQVVMEIESRLSVCEQIEQTVDDSLRKAEHLRQSILKQAFEGKLVPQEQEKSHAG